MIIGDSFIAKKFKNYSQDKNVLIFDMYSYNSKEIETKLYKKEKKQLLDTLSGIKENVLFIYFGTCSIFDENEKNTPYVKHKLAMEELVKNNSNNYLIIRKAQLVGDVKDVNLIVNFLLNSVSKEEKINLWKNAYRNVLDIDTFYVIVDYIIENKLYLNEIINIANPQNIAVIDIIRDIEIFLGKKGKYSLIEKGSEYVIDINGILPIFNIKNIFFEDNYFLNLLNKYYQKKK